VGHGETARTWPFGRTDISSGVLALWV